MKMTVSENNLPGQPIQWLLIIAKCIADFSIKRTGIFAFIAEVQPMRPEPLLSKAGKEI
jgi:hypothetical protein